MAYGEGNVSGLFCFPQGVGAVGEEKHIEAGVHLLDRVVFTQTADVKLYFCASLHRIFSSSTPFIFHVVAVHHLRL